MGSETVANASQTWPLLSLLVWLPIIGGFACLALGNGRASVARWVALAFALATLALSIPLLTGFDYASAGAQFVEQHAWIPAYDIQYRLGADGISVALIALTSLVTVLVLIGISAIAGSVVFLAIGHIRWNPLMHWAPTRHLVEVSRTAWRICGSRNALGIIAASSFVVHLMTILAAWCMVQSVSATTSFALLVFLVPPVILIATVPISIAGWGVREGSMIVAFGYAGLPQSDGLVVSVLIGLTFFAIGAIGGIVWIVSNGRRSATAVAASPSPGDTP